MENIDPREPLTQEEFCELFEQLPLTEDERVDIKENYWGIYKVCLDNPEVEPVTAWMATKNTFIATQPQIGERVQELKENLKD